MSESTTQSGAPELPSGTDADSSAPFPDPFSPPSPRAPRQERGRRRLDDILDAAEQLLLEVGPNGASIQEIARRAGSSVGSIYHFFPTKDAILAALRARFDAEGQLVVAEIRRTLPEAADLPLDQFVDRFLSPVADFVERRPAAFRWVFNQEIKAAKSDAHSIDDALGVALRKRDPHCSAEELARRVRICSVIGSSIAELISSDSATSGAAYVAEIKRALYGYLLTFELDAPGVLT